MYSESAHFGSQVFVFIFLHLLSFLLPVHAHIDISFQFLMIG